MTTHKNQVGQDGAGINGGEFAAKTNTDAPEGIIPVSALMNTWPGPGASLFNDLAAQVVPGAVAVRIRENEDESRYAETTFGPVDLEGHIGDAFTGSDMGDTTEEWIAEHDPWIRSWFRERNITIVGDWPQSVLVHISDLDENADTFHDVTEAFKQSPYGTSLREAVTGEFNQFWNELTSDIGDSFCSRCFGDLNQPGDEFCNTCQEED